MTDNSAQEGGQAAQKPADKSSLATIKNLWPYMWPSDRPDLKVRVLWAALFLVAAKLVTAIVPFFFKFATDALDGLDQDIAWLPVALTTPIMLVIGFNVARLVMTGFNQLRDALNEIAQGKIISARHVVGKAMLRNYTPAKLRRYQAA